MATQKQLEKNANVRVATIKQTGGKEFGFDDKELHYLVIETEAGKETINVGKKTVEKISKLTAK